MYQTCRGHCEDWSVIREMYEAQEGKAFPYAMELTDAGGPLIGSGSGYYGAYNPYVAGTVPYGRVQSPISQREAMTHSQVYGGAEPIDWLMDAVAFTTNAASSAKYHFENNDGEKFVCKKLPTDPPNIQEAPFQLTDLIKMPNPYMDWTEFLEVTLIDFLLVGNGYWVKWKPVDGKPTALYRMPPQFVRIVPDEYGPAKYLYKLPMMKNEISFDPSEVMHFRRTNPHDPYYGVGIVKGGARALDMELGLTSTAASYYENQALPTGVVQTDRRVPRDVFNKLKQQIQSFYGGSRNAGRLMVLEAGLKFTGVSPTAGDALFQEMGAWSRDRIFAMFNLNKSLLGIYDGGDGVPAIADWQRLFDQKTMTPLLNKFAGAISRGLTEPAWELEFKFDYEETQAPDDVINRANLLAKLPGVKVHELRAAAGLPPSTGDEDTDNTVLNLPGPELDENGQGGWADQPLPGEPGRPPIASNTRKFPNNSPAPGKGTKVAGKALQTVDELLDFIEAKQAALEKKALPPARTHVGAISNATPPQDSLHATRGAEIDAIVNDMTREIQTAVHDLERGLLDASEGKATGNTMYQRVKNSKAWAAFRERLAQILESGAQRGVSLANLQHAKVGHTPNLDVDYATVAKDQVYREEGVLSIVKNFKQEVLQDILTLQRHGSNPGEFTKSILASMDTWKTGHAKTVALTEATLAYNEGTFLVTETNGLDKVLVSDGEDHDEPCAEANGQIWTLEQARENSIEHPNCRRAFVPYADPT